MQDDIANRVLSIGDGLLLPKAELLDFSQQLLYDLSDIARGIATELWELNENYVIDALFEDDSGSVGLGGEVNAEVGSRGDACATSQ